SIERNAVNGDDVKLPIDKYSYTQIPNGGYTLVFTSSEARDFKNFLDEARRYAGESEGLERVKLLTEFVYKTIEYDINFADGVNVIMLRQVIKNRKGTCLEEASLLYMILREEDFDVSFAVGTITDGGIYRHAWVKVRIDEELYVADPTNNITMVAAEFNRKLNVDRVKFKFDVYKLLRS
ncbi:MAG: transglutaminase-like domain-containing protein, partial [Candidatus Micrarchaeaceae archaeon]